MEYKLLDGGIVCPVPYEYMENLGFNRNVIVLTQPKDYRKKKPGKFLISLFLNKYPKIKKSMLERYLVYNKQMDEIDKKEENGSCLVIRPPKKLDLSKTEKSQEKLEAAYQIGRQEALKRLDEVKKYLSIN